MKKVLITTLLFAPFAAMAQEVVAPIAEAAAVPEIGWLGLVGMIAPIVISAAAAIAAVFPQGKDGGVWYYVRKVIDFLALNFGNAKNAVK